MDAQLKAKWVEALRSGEYGQTDGQLQRGRSYCCLGVLCVIADIAINATGVCPVIDGAETDSYQPIWDRLGSRHQELVQMNDSGSTFAEIADFIEANL